MPMMSGWKFAFIVILLLIEFIHETYLELCARHWPVGVACIPVRNLCRGVFLRRNPT